MGFEDSPSGGLSLVSFHSISKGFIGECGIRGGYFELFGIDPEVRSRRPLHHALLVAEILCRPFQPPR
jgi:aspartate/methionine/tyrosine aminotransferase